MGDRGGGVVDFRTLNCRKDEEAAYDTIYHKSKGVDRTFLYGFWSYGEEFFDMRGNP
jgi:hypothetical protein